MIDPAAILAFDFGAPEQEYTPRDAILYALGVGFGADPLDAEQLRFLDERNLSVLPTFAVTLCSPGMWIRDPSLGVDFGKLVHSAQDAEFFAELPASGRVAGTAKVVSLTDRGAGKGAVLVLERTISDAKNGTLLCRLRQTLLLRGDGGFGGQPAVRDADQTPERAPDATAVVETSSRAALLYRLSGDWNPLHLDPAIARQAGFARPILQGLASYAIAGSAVSRLLGKDPAKIARLTCRFSGVVLPGDIIAFDVWTGTASTTHFTGRVNERPVLSAGEIFWRDN